MLRMVFADWRRLLVLNLLGWSFFVFIMALIYRDFSRCGEPALCYSQLKLHKWLFVSLLYGQAPLVIWAQLGGTGSFHRQPLFDTLPLSPRRLNISRILLGIVLLATGSVSWVALIWIWRGFGLSIPSWLVVQALLMVFLFWLISLRNLFPRVLLPVLVVLLVVPVTEQYLRMPLDWAARPWTSLVLAAAIGTALWRVVEEPPPPWTRSL